MPAHGVRRVGVHACISNNNGVRHDTHALATRHTRADSHSYAPRFCVCVRVRVCVRGDLIARTVTAGKIAGIITFDESRFKEYAEKGVTFLGVGGDLAVLNGALRGLAARATA